jgi:hypothetical protein
MVLLIITIAALSHLATTGSQAERVATDQLPLGIESITPRSAIGDRNMWISIFAVAVITAVCLGIAAFLLQPAEVV